MNIQNVIIKGINLALAGILSLLGFVGCEKTEPLLEYGMPHADYTVKGVVVNKATGKPIEGIRVGYDSIAWAIPEYGVIGISYQPKSRVLDVMTNEKGEFKLTDSFFPDKNLTLPVYIDDIDGEKNGLFQSERLEVDFSKAVQTGKPSSWYEGEFTVTKNVELTEIEEKTDE
jgi:putative lipoprotein (rSAM/lipoprotein system)